MGWQSECGTHEGYLVGLVFDDAGTYSGRAGYPKPPLKTGRLRELSADDTRVLRLTYVKVACACGWRSPLLRAASGTEWMPSCVLTSEAFDDACHELWKRHVAESGEAHDGGYSIHQLVRAGRR